MPCECINIDLIVDGELVSVEVTPNGNIVGGVEQFEAPFFETNIFIEYDDVNSRWIMYVGNDPFFAFFTSSNESCPFGIWAVVVGEGNPTFAETTPCAVPCDCIRLCITKVEGGEPITECIELTTSTGTFNGLNYWQFNLFGSTFSLYYSGNWRITQNDALGVPPDSGILLFTSKATGECPYNVLFTALGAIYTGASTSECVDVCVIYQNRTKKEYNSVKLPEIFEEENRGYFRCCCEANVLASTTSSDSWKNDITSAWIKLSDPTDTATFELYKDGQLATYQPTPVTFPKEPLARYVTIPWKSVLGIDGAGCYRLDITFSIAGVSQTFTWGKYKLKPYSIENALETARVRAIFNAYNEIEQIDFTDSKVVDTLRFYGFIGNAQPNMEIDNIIYDNREMKKVIRENLNTYEIITDPICEDFTKALKDLYLLSENELFISDYNAHNHSYRYQDLPVIVTESPEIEYYDFSREAKLTCIVGDKFKNKRSYYK